MKNVYIMNIQLFADFVPHVTPGTPTLNPVNLTSTGSLSPAMRDFYVKALLENAREDIIYEQFGLKTPIKGNKAVWRKMDTIGKALTPLEEGVIPEGKKLGMESLEVTTTQHGDYTAVSDKKTAFNLTNHAYFNLNGEDGENVFDTILSIDANSLLA